MRKIILFISILICYAALILSCETKANYTNISPEELSLKYKEYSDMQILDVRTPEEYANGNINGSVLIDISDPYFESKINAYLDKKHPVMVYCASGKRSEKAAQELSKLGYKVYNLSGGYKAYSSYIKMHD